MRYWTIVCPFLPANGMALFPFILVKDRTRKQDQILINHEKIHLQQQIELLVIPFYLLYLMNYLLNLLRYKKHDKAYRQLSFEQEAYANETNLDYLKTRKFCAWRTY